MMKGAKEIWANVAERNNEHRFVLAIQTTSGVRVAWGEQAAAASKYELLELVSLERNPSICVLLFFFIETLVFAERKMQKIRVIALFDD